MESKKSLFEPLFKLDVSYKPKSLENCVDCKIIISDEIWTVDNLISKEEADQLIECSEKAGYVDAQIGSEDGKEYQTIKEIRDSRRVLVDDKGLADYIFERCKDLVPRAFEGGLLLNMNEKIRFLRYDTPGNHFFPHLDACVKRNESELSMITFQIYLSEDIEGGSI